MRYRLAIREHAATHELSADALLAVFVLVGLSFVAAAAGLIMCGIRATGESPRGTLRPPRGTPRPPPRPSTRPPLRPPCVDSLWRVLEPASASDIESALKQL